jgi:3-deoxy-D-manno-octulosonic-acid transferase
VRSLARALYAVAAKVATAAGALIPPSDSKAVIAIRARRGIRGRYAAWAAASRDPSRPLLWMHAPSVGEGHMARPILTLMRANHPETQLAYTFFSPSAEEFSRGLDVDFRDYLPFDDAGDMAAALDALKPRALVFSKVDVWPELVRQAKARGIRVGMISAALAAGSRRRGRIARYLLSEAYAALDAVGAVDASDADRLVELGVRRDAIEVTGDTRFDQVWQRAEKANRSSGLLHRLESDRPTLVAGSTWPADEAPLLESILRVRQRIPTLRVIVAPHEPAPHHVEPIERWAAQAKLSLARIDSMAAAKADVILVDRFGVLGDLYALATITFVGGGFHGAGLHSVLEPASFGAPVLFGPQHHKSRDALMLIVADGAREVASADQLASVMTELLGDPARTRQVGDNARETVRRGTGAAARSLALVERLMSA